MDVLGDEPHVVDIAFTELKQAPVLGGPQLVAEIDHADQMHGVVCVVMPSHRVTTSSTLQHDIHSAPIPHVCPEVLKVWAAAEILHEREILWRHVQILRGVVGLPLCNVRTSRFVRKESVLLDQAKQRISLVLGNRAYTVSSAEQVIQYHGNSSAMQRPDLP